MQLKPALLETLTRLGYRAPTPIQSKVIPPALAGRDVLGCAQTGTGKTAAFCLPLLQRFDDGLGRRPKRVRALVLSPTRELAAQIGKSLAEYGKSCAVSHTVVFGGVGQSEQVRDLRRGVDVLVATPGRLEDLVSQRLADLSGVEVLVIDEVDRMLDQGFLPAVRRITRLIPEQRQTMMFSATLARELRHLARELLHDPVEVAANTVASIPTAIDQQVFLVDAQLKRRALERLLERSDFTRALVFTRTKHGADRVARHLKGVYIEADAIHGGKSQNARERTLAAFRDGHLRVLVATDLASRGIHVDGISHVINFDLPKDPDNYVHRIGRTARAGASGQAFTLCSPEERDDLYKIERTIQRRFELKTDPTLTEGGSAAPSARSIAAERGEAMEQARNANSPPTGDRVRYDFDGARRPSFAKPKGHAGAPRGSSPPPAPQQRGGQRAWPLPKVKQRNGAPTFGAPPGGSFDDKQRSASTPRSNRHQDGGRSSTRRWAPAR
jgi:ATP-dependent RNA helicase RhlE